MEERRPYGKGEIRGNRLLFYTFYGVTSARAWVKKMEAFVLLHPVVEREAVDITVLHLEEKPSTSMDGVAIAWEGEAFSATQSHPKTH